VLELLNRFGADGWELSALQDYREGGDGSNYWEAARLLTVYTFKRPVSAQPEGDSHFPLGEVALTLKSQRDRPRWILCRPHP
jgi:hypothetical protein